MTVSPNLNNTESSETAKSIIAQFKSADGESTGPPLNLPINVTPEQLEHLLNKLLDNDEPLPYTFHVDDLEVTDSLKKDVVEGSKKSTEDILTIVYQPQAIFRVRAVSRCSSTLSGHSEAVLSVHFSPDGRQLASGSGDTTVRIWDLDTETPKATLKSHKSWVLCVAWAPDCKTLASGSMDSTIQLWDPLTGNAIGSPLKGHRDAITSLSWEPMHSNPDCNRLASSSKDGTVKVWDTKLRHAVFSLSQHTKSVTCVKWGGKGLIYTASRDCTIKVWDAKQGKLVRSLQGHGHWVNTMALSTDYILRTGPFDHTDRTFDSKEAAHKAALERYRTHKGKSDERLVSGSDDFTLFLWNPEKAKQPVARLTGHQQLVNQVIFSPSGHLLASASFDKSIKLWDGFTGKFMYNLRAHVASVYQICFSSDSRLLLSASKDSTCKIWDLKTRKMKVDLPGHADEVYAVDWSPNGEKAASGSKDKALKIWRQ
ncbi:WD40-repeat-containing domain protein [Paraphysoderma sedebokerense]|nr:WD40-repeat-containing domain protein [Paraphysoderma sedebokerense]